MLLIRDLIIAALFAGTITTAGAGNGVIAVGDKNGGHFTSTSATRGIGVTGLAEATGAITNYGGWFEAHGDTGRGIGAISTGNSSYAVKGIATATGTAVENYGGHFEARGSNGIGVSGISNRHIGVFGEGKFGMQGNGAEWGGYFLNTGNDDNTHYVILAGKHNSNNYGVISFGTDGGGIFADTSTGTYANVGASAHKIIGTGSVSFVQNHPENNNQVIVYTAPEGDEVSTYTRGSAQLINGEARIILGETFKWVTNPDIGLTAHLTPQGEGTVLYVASKTTEELVVRSMEGFPDDVAFDYIVRGLRIGFEETSVVQEKDQEAYIPSMRVYRERYANYPELKQYNALERFGRMQAAMGKSVDRDASASKALKDAVIEFDPDIHTIPSHADDIVQ